jgi:polysaccharide biosynthesis protein PslG
MLPRARARIFARLVLLAALALVAAASGTASAASGHSPAARPAAKHLSAKARERRAAACRRALQLARHHSRIALRIQRRHHCARSRRPSRAHSRGPAAPGSASLGGLQFGLNSMWFNDSDLTRVHDAGVTMARVEIDWGAVEPSRGNWRWGTWDPIFAKAAAHGVTLLPILMGPPSWAGLAWNQIPTDPSGYADYVAHVVARYGPGGSFWKSNPGVAYHPASYFEIWNEPYWIDFARGGSNPQNYARLYRAAVAAGRAANPQARYLIEADTSGTTPSLGYVEWVDAMYRAVPDLNNYVDGVAVHPYSQPRGPDVYTPSGFSRWQFRRIEQIRQKFVNHGASDKPFWITEIGWPTCPANPGKCVPESTQAADTARMIDMLKTDYASYVRAVFLYNYHDPSRQDPSNMENWFGLFRAGGSPKPVWDVLRKATGAI